MPDFKSPAEIVAPKIGAIYRHYKGTEYVVKDITRDSETLGLRVSYYNDPADVPWSRPLFGLGPDFRCCGWCDVAEDPVTGEVLHRFTLVGAP